ncbi:MAG: MGMT family protein [Patescibacteria group bacterium]
MRVLEVVKKIPAGKTMTYGEVAEAAGRPGAARAVGNIMNRNYNTDIPCHRVIRSDGKLGGYNRGRERKRRLLYAESRKRVA